MSAPPPSIELSLPVALTPGATDAAHDPAAVVVALFDEHATTLLRYIRATGLEPAAAEDVLQDTFVALHRHLQLRRSRVNLVGWLFRVAINLSRREHRRRRRGLALAPWSDAIVARLVHPRPTPERELERRETGRRLQAAVETLSERDRSCLRLRAEGVRYRDIAAAMDMSLGSVAKSVGRSLAFLTRAVKG